MDASALRAWLARHKETQESLAVALGVSLSTVSRWCRGATDVPPWLPVALRGVLGLRWDAELAEAERRQRERGRPSAMQEIVDAIERARREPPPPEQPPEEEPKDDSGSN